jgi:hypothetical protein
LWSIKEKAGERDIGAFVRESEQFFCVYHGKASRLGAAVQGRENVNPLASGSSKVFHLETVQMAAKGVLCDYGGGVFQFRSEKRSYDFAVQHGDIALRAGAGSDSI